MSTYIHNAVLIFRSGIPAVNRRLFECQNPLSLGHFLATVFVFSSFRCSHTATVGAIDESCQRTANMMAAFSQTGQAESAAILFLSQLSVITQLFFLLPRSPLRALVGHSRWSLDLTGAMQGTAGLVRWGLRSAW